MNSGIKDASHPSIVYYDSDYPSKQYTYAENFDNVVKSQGIDGDVEKYKALASSNGKRVLEVCCGTGRVSIPLVQSGCSVTAVDNNAALLKQFKKKTDALADLDFKRLTLVKQDVTQLALSTTDFDIVICAFNSLLCIPDFALQQAALVRMAAHVKTRGMLVLDIWNPLALNIYGDQQPEPFFTRKNVHNGNVYTRYAAVLPMEMDQVQHVYGWYDETQRDGTVTRQAYEMLWRPIFRYEIQLMLEKAGFLITKISGGHNDESLTRNSLKMFIEAVKV